ncbi:Mediator of RNA polymerase II transcription subunit 13 [Erysiphe necator]|nr:Mediator of RNA polymerase II transcription subunit 13 [Erysiphe necator]
MLCKASDILINDPRSLMMEPGEYSTNIISINNLAHIQYDYFDSSSPVTSDVKNEINRLENKWRKEGRLIYCDFFQNRIWAFQSLPNSPILGSIIFKESINDSDVKALGYMRGGTGIFEPASLTSNRNLSTLPKISNNGLSNLGKEILLKKSQMHNDRTSQTKETLYNSSELCNNEKKSSAVSLDELYEYFISAVLGSIRFCLCRDNKFIQFNSRTLIPTKSQPALYAGYSDIVEFATLDVDLTSMGTLMIKIYFDLVCGFQNLGSKNKLSDFSKYLRQGDFLWLAPSGIPAKFYCLLDNIKIKTPGMSESYCDNLVDASFEAAVKPWKKQILRWLSYQGLDSAVLNENGWLVVQILGNQLPLKSTEHLKPLLPDYSKIVPWPAILCFKCVHQNSHKLKELSSEETYPRDPLTFAEDWFISQEQRDLILSKRLNERKSVETTSKERVDTDTRAACSHSDSPITLRKGSISGNIYPTPPDAMHSLIGATPSFDGSISIPLSSNNFPHPDPLIICRNADSSQSILEGWVPSTKREHDSSSYNYNENYSENDNTMCDLDGELFGNDVTDADFNFFDEPDVTPMDLDPKPLNVASHATTQIPEQEEELVVNVSLLESKAKLNNETLLSNNKILDENGKHKLISLEHPQPQTHYGLFNKETVFNQLNFDNSNALAEKKEGQYSLYDKVEFSESLLSVNEKYSASGPFNFSIGVSKLNTVNIPSLLKTNYLQKMSLKRSSKVIKREQHSLIPLYMGTFEAKTRGSRESSVDSDSSSEISEQDKNSTYEEKSHRTCRISVRGTPDSDENNDADPTYESSVKGCEQITPPELFIDEYHIHLLTSDPSDWPLNLYLSSQGFDEFLCTFTDQEYVAMAQILVDQAVSATFQLFLPPKVKRLQETQQTTSTRKVMRCLTEAAKVYFKDVNVCNFRNFLDIQGIHVSNQVLRLPPRPNTNQRLPLGANERPKNIFVIPPPRVQVRRADSSFWVLPTAITYWENIGLAPSSGPKNIESVCIYPDFEGMALNSSIFLDRMRSIYESYRFGSHQRILSEGINDGLISFTTGGLHNKTSNPTPLREILGKLGRVFSCLSSQDNNFVVYFVYPVDNSWLILNICSAFQHLIKVYRKVLHEKKITRNNEIVLQLVPLSLITSPSSLAIPSPSEYFGLALELYDRCINPASSSMPAIILESSLPKSIDFKLNPNPPESLLQENSCLHIAYSQSNDCRWITTAWTDNRGTEQMTACYCLGRKNEIISTSFSKVANEIWETTMEFISDVKVNRRIIIAKVGVMDPSEIEVWTGLASKEIKSSINLILVTTKPNSSLRLLPFPLSLGSKFQTIQSPTRSSLSVTPGAHALSSSSDNTSITVDIHNEPDINARIIDSTDQTWGAVLSHRLNNSNSLVEINLALISGYLIKPGGSNLDDSPSILEVNIIYGEIIGNPRTFHESLLKEILGYYRGLGTLARVRGIVDPIRDIRPWHIAAVEKAAHALWKLM